MESCAEYKSRIDSGFQQKKIVICKFGLLYSGYQKREGYEGSKHASDRAKEEYKKAMKYPIAVPPFQFHGIVVKMLEILYFGLSECGFQNPPEHAYSKHWI